MRRPREYKIRYFDRFGVQRQVWSAKLDEPFFREWYDKLSVDPEKNWHISASTCIRLLVEHPDAPDWLRDMYSKHSRYDRRHSAFLIRSSDYKYKNIDRIISDRSGTIRDFFIGAVMQDLKDGILISFENLIKIITLPPHHIRTDLRETIREGDVALVSPNPIVRTLAKILYEITEEQKNLLESTITIRSKEFSDPRPRK